MKFSHFSLFLALTENAVNCIPSTTITGSLVLFEKNICENEGQLAIGTVDLALDKKVYLKDSGVTVPIQSLKWQYPGPFKLSFYDGKAELPYAIVIGPDEATFVSTICSGFKTDGLGGSSLKNVTILDQSRVKPDFPIFDSPESYFIVESSSSSLTSPLEPSSEPNLPPSNSSSASSSSSSFSSSLASSISAILSSLF